MADVTLLFSLLELESFQVVSNNMIRTGGFFSELGPVQALFRKRLVPDHQMTTTVLFEYQGNQAIPSATEVGCKVAGC